MKKVLALFFAVLMSTAAFAENKGENLLLNGGFEAADSAQKPLHWTAEHWIDSSEYKSQNQKTHSGKMALEIKSGAENDIRLVQVAKVKPNTFYKLSGWIATEKVILDKTGANLCVVDDFHHTISLNGTSDWLPVELNFLTHSNQTEVKIGARLGMWGNTVTGTVWFDDLSLVELDKRPDVYEKLVDKNETGKSQPKRKGNWIWLLPIAVLAIAGIIIYDLKKKK